MTPWVAHTSHSLNNSKCRGPKHTDKLSKNLHYAMHYPHAIKRQVNTFKSATQMRNARR